MIGAIQYRGAVGGVAEGVVGFPGQDVGSTGLRGKRAEFEVGGFSSARRMGSGGGGGSGTAFKQQRDERNRAWATLRQEIEALEEPERWDGLA